MRNPYSLCIMMTMMTQHRLTQKQRKSYTNESKVSQTGVAHTQYMYIHNKWTASVIFRQALLVWHDNFWYDSCSTRHEKKTAVAKTTTTKMWILTLYFTVWMDPENKWNTKKCCDGIFQKKKDFQLHCNCLYNEICI